MLSEIETHFPGRLHDKETKPTKLESLSPSAKFLSCFVSIIPPNGECRFLEIIL